MPPLFEQSLRITWLVLGVYWLWSARFVNGSALQESRLIRFAAYWFPIIVAALLLGPGPWFGHSILREQFVPHTTFVYSFGLALAVLGASLAIYSRALLGRNWSATVELKQGHELITHGPYSRIRHPIYTGLLLLFLGNAVMVGDWRGLLAVAIIFASFWRKLRVEEKLLTNHFGEAYSAYQRNTKALIPAVL